MIRAACFDLETTNLSADFGILLCAVIRDSVGETKVFRGDELNPGWKDGKRSNDRGLVKAVAKELESYDILAAHNGVKFDLPFLRTRMLRWRLKPLAKLKIIDPMQIAFRNLRMSRNSLARIADLRKCNAKTEVPGDIWNRAALDGDKKAMDYVVHHCIKDVEVLEKVVLAVKPYCGNFNTWGSAF